MKKRTEKIINQFKKDYPRYFSDYLPTKFWIEGYNDTFFIFEQSKEQTQLYVLYSCKEVQKEDIPSELAKFEEGLKFLVDNKQVKLNSSCTSMQFYCFDKNRRSLLWSPEVVEVINKIKESEKVVKSKKPSDITFKFGKHKGKKVSEVIKEGDIRYLEWFAINIDTKTNTRSILNSVTNHLDKLRNEKECVK